PIKVVKSIDGYLFSNPGRLRIPLQRREHLTYAMSINTYSRQQLENLQLDHKEK
ncbi:transposase, partial [Microcystis aeruginosa 11-30S32]